MGLFTFARVIQSTFAIIIYARGINRIRHLYLEYAPQMQPYFILSAHDDSGSVLAGAGIRVSRWQVFFLTPGLIAFINSILLGVSVGLLLNILFAWSLLVCTGAGIVAFLVSIVIHQRYQWDRFKRSEQNIPVLFPSQARE